jgi:ferredoxin/coenzyme F420-reducing hydrogenase delta subunit
MQVSTVQAIDPDPSHWPARGLSALERGIDRLGGAGANPLRHLGGMAMLAFWLSVASGVYVYVGFDTSATGAWKSVQALLSHPVEGPIKSLHRYSSFALIALTLLHLGVEWAKGRYRGFRWFSWTTGIVPLWLAVACAMVGYWLIGDTRAQYVAAGIGEWVGVLPGVGASLMRNFITDEALSDRLLSLLIFVHIGAGLFLLLAIWVHLARLVRPQAWPRRATGIAFTLALIALCVVLPALSGPRADFARVPGPVAIDWLAYGVLPLMHATTPAVAWGTVAGATLFLVLLPWLGRRTRAPQPAVVDAANCNGCGRCFDDCPYGAIVLVPHPIRPHRAMAQVAPDQCAACGICVGACPSSSPFRSVADLVTGIDLPQRRLDELRRRLDAALQDARAAGVSPLVVFGCDHGERVDTFARRQNDASLIALSLPCSAALPPAFVEFAQRAGAVAVVVADCGEHGCAYRFGAAFTRARALGERAPHLRRHARGRVRIVSAGPGAAHELDAAVAAARRLPAEQVDA